MRRMMPWLGAMLFMAMLTGTGEAQTVKTQPEVWMCHAKAEQLADAPWDAVKQRLDVLEFFIDAMSQCPPEKLKAVAQQLNEHKIKVAVECGGLLEYAPGPDETLGEESAKIELGKLAHLDAAGIKPSYLNIDGPVNRAMHPSAGRKPLTREQAVHETLDYMKAVRAVYPDLQFYLLSNFPNWGWKGGPCYWNQPDGSLGYGDYNQVVRILVKEARAAGMPFLGMTVDNPLDYLTGVHASPGLPDPKKIDWMKRVRELEDWTHAEKMRFNLIVNCETSGMGSDEQYSKDTLTFIDTYKAAGGRPDVYLIESWYPHPLKAAPETEPWTMTHLVKAVLEKVKPAAASPAAQK